MEEGTRVITLSPNTQVSEVTFEDAFGEHSNLKGKGRARRQARHQKRRMGRIKNRQEHRLTKQEGRQRFKDIRKERRVARKKMGDEPETEMDNQTAMETGNGYQESPQNDYQAPSDQIQESQGGGSDNQSSGGYQQPSGDGAYPETVESQSDEGFDEGSEDSGEEGGEDEGGDDYGFDGKGSNDPYSLGEYTIEDFSGFDGDELESSFSDASGKRKKIHPAVLKLVVQIAANRAKVAALRLEKNAAKAAGNEAKTNQLKAKIRATLAKIEQLRTIKRNFKQSDAANAEQVNGANTSLQNYVATKRQNKANSGGSETPVEAELNPKFGEQRIEVAASSNAQGPYSNPEDLANDYDAPETRTVELTSSAEGKKGKINIDWKLVGIGAVIAVAGILVYNKYIKK